MSLLAKAIIRDMWGTIRFFLSSCRGFLPGYNDDGILKRPADSFNKSSKCRVRGKGSKWRKRKRKEIIRSNYATSTSCQPVNIITLYASFPFFSRHTYVRSRNLGFRFLQTLQKSGKDMGARSSAKSTEISRYGQKLGRKEKENEEDAAWHERKSLSLPRWRL